MKLFAFTWIAALVFALLGPMLVAGCAPPDRWGPFGKDFEQSLPRVDTTPVPIPEDLKPKLAELHPFHRPLDGEPVELSVEQATMLTLDNNKDLHVQLLTPVIAGTYERIERGRYDPELFAAVSYDRDRAVETSRSTQQEFDVEGEDAAAVIGLRQRIPTGTEIEASLGQAYSKSSRTPDQYISRVDLGITQALLRGFGAAANLASVRQAKMDFVASLYELRAFTEALVADSEISYWNYVLAGQKIAIFDSSLDIARRQREETELRIEVGALPKTEAAAARAEVALHEQALIDARSEKEVQRLHLLRWISPGPEGHLDLQINATSPSRIEPVPIQDLAEHLLLAELSRPDLKEAQLRREQNRLETVVTGNGLLPRLDLFVRLGKTGFAKAFSDSFHQLDSDTYDLQAGIQFSRPVGNRAAEAQNLAARASVQQMAEAVANLLEIVRLDVRLAVNEVERARRQIAATAATRELQEQVVASERERFDVGASTTLLVAQAQRDLLASRIIEVEAVVNYRIALIKLYLAEGSLLERRGIRIEETRNQL